LETPERNVTWILVVSLIMFFGSAYVAYLVPYTTLTSGRDAWYYLTVIMRFFITLTIGSSALCIARFAKRWTYYGSVALFSIFIILLLILGLRPLF
jgi:hypothetical protein